MCDISTSVTHFPLNFGYESKFTLYCGLSGLWYFLALYVCHPVAQNCILNTVIPRLTSDPANEFFG